MQFTTILALAVSTVAAFSLPAFSALDQPQLTNCGTSTDELTLTSFTVTPYPIVANANATITAVGSLSVPVTAGAKVSVAISEGFIPLTTQVVDLCTEAAKAGIKCPVAAGKNISLSISVAVPSAVPSGTYTVKITATNSDGKELTCQTGDLTIA